MPKKASIHTQATMTYNLVREDTNGEPLIMATVIFPENNLIQDRGAVQRFLRDEPWILQNPK